jgi:hypothetical protein
MPHSNGRTAFDRDLELRNGRLQIEPLFLDELKQHRGGIRLGQRGQVVDRVRPCGNPALTVGESKAVGPDHFVAFGNGGGHPRDAKPNTHRLQLPLEVEERVDSDSGKVRFPSAEPPTRSADER